MPRFFFHVLDGDRRDSRGASLWVFNLAAAGLVERLLAGYVRHLANERGGGSEPPRVRRRPFGLSHAAMAGCSSMA